jgi:hypothetical protein
MGVILNLGYINPAEPVLTTPEGAGVLVGGGLLVAGATMVKGKGGMLMMLIGGIAALAGLGSAAYRAIAKPAGAMPGAPLPPAPAKPTSTAQQAQAIVQQLAPTLTPLLKNLFSSSPTPAPAPSSAMVTSYSQLAPAPAPSSDGGFGFNDYGG